MGFKDFFKANEYKEKAEKLQAESILLQQTVEEMKQRLKEQDAVLTDSHKEAIDINRFLVHLQEERDRLNYEIASLQEEQTKRIQEIQNLKDDLIELNDDLLLQDFGLYKPMYSFATSEEYKARLDRCRLAQKKMIKEKTAANCPISWQVNGSKAQGRKMTNDNIKETILMFNTECENVIDRVKFNNFDSMKKRIQRMFEKLNKLNEVNAISISQEYLELKIEELTLAYEYAQKKQEEKEYIREQREIQRENAKVQMEIEAERKRIEKEKAHYRNVVAKLIAQLATEQNNEKRVLLKEKIVMAEGEIDELEVALKDIDYREANERAGYVYVISNIGAFGEDIYKIGMTRRLDPQDRVDELGGASVPFRFDVHAFIFSTDAPKLETALHNAFSDKRVNMINNRKEFFHVTLQEIEDVVRKNHDKTVEFQYTPVAEQYRETMKLKQETTR